MTLKLVGWWTLGLALVFGAGWFVGASGRSALDQERREAVAFAEFSEARGFVQDGRIGLFLSNFGQANRSFEAARAVVERIQTELRRVGEAAKAGQLEVAVAQL